MIKLIHGDCLEKMKDIPDKSIDMILCDLPYGSTACKWDVIIPFEPLWIQYKRVIKDNGAIVLFGSQPFTTDLIMSNREMFRYELIWEKTRPSNFMLSKKQPLKYHENIEVFYKKQPIYNPIMKKGNKNHNSKVSIGAKAILGLVDVVQPINISDIHYPSSIISIKSTNSAKNLHTAQKPVALLEYLIKTYTLEGETVLDNCAGSFSTAVACDNTNRNWICIEKEEEYCNIGLTRINDNRERLSLPLLKLYNSRGDLIGDDD